MNKYFKNLPVIVCVLFATSCQKKDATPADLSKVNVVFNTPVAQQVYHKGDVVNIEANVTYTSEIIGIGIQIIDSSSDNVLFQEDHDLHNDRFTIGEAWTDTLSANTTLCLKVTVFVANTTEKAERSIYFTAKP